MVGTRVLLPACQTAQNLTPGVFVRHWRTSLSSDAGVRAQVVATALHILLPVASSLPYSLLFVNK